MATDVQPFRTPRELERAGALCLAFANTVVPRHDSRTKEADRRPARPFVEYSELVDWELRMGVLVAAEAELLLREAAARPEEAAAVAASARELRAADMRFFTELAFGREPRARDLAVLNAALRPQKLVPAPTPREFRSTYGGDPGALDRVLAPLAQRALDLVVWGKLEKLRQCAAGDCWRLFLYRSSRRLWCDMNLCGNRFKSARHHRKHRR